MYLVNFISAKFRNLKIGRIGILSMFSVIRQRLKKLGLIAIISLLYFNIGSALAAEKTVGDNFPNILYSQNSGSENWSGNWIEVGESDGTSAGIARVRNDLCSGGGGNCLRLGVPSGNRAQTYNSKGVYRELDLSRATSATLSFVYRKGVNSGNQTVIVSVYNGNAWIDLESYYIDRTNTSSTTATFDLLDYVTNISSITRIRFLASGRNAIVGMYIDDIEIKYEVSNKLSVSIGDVSQAYDVSSYGGSSQDRTGTVDIRDAGLSLFLEGNRWQKIDFPYTVTENTIIEFDFKSDIEGEIQGLGFDTDLSISSNRSFKVYGTQNWGLSDFATYSGSGVTHFTIPVGEFYTGNFQYLFFIHDDDSIPTSDSLFSNINVYEKKGLIAEYRFDETSWSGLSADVLDTSGNNLHGTATNVQPLSGLVCNAANFDRLNRIEVANNTLLEVGNNNADYTVNFWLSPRSTTGDWSNVIHKGSINYERTFAAWFQPGNTRIHHQASTTSNDNEGHDSNAALGLNTWTMVTLVKQGDQVMTYFNGILEKQTTLAGSTKSNSGPLYIGDDPWYSGIDALMDELTIFGSALSATEIQDIRTNNLSGNGWDGSERNCPVSATLIAEYRFEESSWDGSTNEVIDSSGSDYHGQVVRNSTLINPPTVSSPAALTGDPGTCNFISQNRGSIKVTGLDQPLGAALNPTLDGEKTTVTFWMKWDGNESVMPIGWNYHDIWLYNGSMGFNTWNNDMYGISSVSLAGSWHHVAVEFTNGSVFSNRMYIDGVEQTLTSRRYDSRYNPRLPNDNNAYVKAEMRIGGVTNSTSYDFRGLLDEVRVYKGTLTTEQVVTIMNERHDCNTPTIHHYEIVHDGQGLTCEAESYTVKACTNASCSTLSTESVTLDVRADGNTINSPTFTGSTTVNFNHTVAETLTLSLANTSIDASDAMVCNDGSGASCDMVFADTGFKFYSSIDSSTIPTQLSAKPSNIGFNASTLKIQAIEKNTNTGACQAALIDNTAIEMAATCVDPIACAGSQVAINNFNSTTNITTLGNTAPLTYSPVTLDFGNNTSNNADFIFTYPNAGKVKLHARYNIRDGDNNRTGNYMLGSSLPFVVRPFGFFIDVLNNPKAQNANQVNSAFIKAGENFTASLSAVQWQAEDDDLLGEANDGVPDSDADLSNNTITTNFGNETNKEVATINDSLYLPASGVEGDLTNDSFTDFTNGVATNGVANNKSMTYSEVGIVKFTANLSTNTYLGAGDITGAVPYVGRFIPHHFELSTGFDGSIISVCDMTSPNTEAPFAYTGQVSSTDATKGALQYKSSLQPELLITAKSSICQSGNCITTQNYTGDFMKLVADDIDYIVPLEDATLNKVGALGTPIKLLANMTDGTLPTEAAGVITYVFNANDNFVYVRDQNSEIALFTSIIELGIEKVEDEDDVLAIDSDGIVGNNRLWVLTPESKEIRFGRVSLENSFGPETSPIGQVLSVEYFDGNDFVLAATDNCTHYNSANISFGTVNEVGLTSPILPSVSGTFNETNDLPDGVTRKIVLPAVAAGNQGKVEVNYTTYPWLQYDWDWNGVEVKTFDENPSAIVTFGLFRGNDRIIYNREVF